MQADSSLAGDAQAFRSARRLPAKFRRAVTAIGALLLLTGAELILTTSAGARFGSSGAAPPTLLQTSQAGRSAHAHVETWAIDDGCSGGSGASGALARMWLTIAESSCGPYAHKANQDCEADGVVYCSVVQYLDTDWVYADAQLPLPRLTPSDWWLHEPGPHRQIRISANRYGGGHLLNQTVPAVRSWFRSYVRDNFDADQGLLMDDQSSSLSEELYYSTCGCKTTYEITSNTVLRNAHNEMSAFLTHRNGSQFFQVDNTLAPNPFLPQGLNMLNHAAGVQGLIAEGEPEQYGGVIDPYYSTLLDQIAYIENDTTAFVVPMSHGYAKAPTLARSRRVQEATVLLAFAPNRIVDWADLEVGSRDLSVWPEEGIYPTESLESMHAPGGHGCLAGIGVVCSTGGHNNLEVAPGVYRREFRDCDDQGRSIGPCAALVNAGATPVTIQSSWLSQTYRHQLTLNGGDVQSGGTVNPTGAGFKRGRTQIAATDAVVLTNGPSSY
jgi:hypothetical protein